MKNREIKFRVFDSLMKRWSNGLFYIDSEGNLWIDDDPNGINMSGKREIRFANIQKYEKDRYIKVFYTGLKDKDGKEVYEGDVIAVIVELCKVKDNEGDWTMSTQNLTDKGIYIKDGKEYKPSKIWKEEKTRTIIKWEDDPATLGGGYNSSRFGGYHVYFPYTHWYRIDEYEIIGNIYENPELIKQADEA